MTRWLKTLDVPQLVGKAGIATPSDEELIHTAEYLDQMFGHDTLERMSPEYLGNILMEYLRKKVQPPLIAKEVFV